MRTSSQETWGQKFTVGSAGKALEYGVEEFIEAEAKC